MWVRGEGRMDEGRREGKGGDGIEDEVVSFDLIKTAPASIKRYTGSRWECGFLPSHRDDEGGRQFRFSGHIYPRHVCAPMPPALWKGSGIGIRDQQPQHLLIDPTHLPRCSPDTTNAR